MKNFLLSLFCSVMVLATANAETYTHKFKNGDLTKDGGNVTLSDIEWDATPTKYLGWADDRGIQLSSKNTANEFYQLSTSALAECTIKSITVETSMGPSSDAKLTITVGDQISPEFPLATSDISSYTFDCEDTTGNISISWTATQRAYYVKSITIDYIPDASSVVIPTPEFKTPNLIYADKVEKVTFGIENQSAVIYYTLDGTDPSYEDYVNGTGSTLTSKYWIKDDLILTKTTTIKAIAVKVDGDVAFKSDIAEQTYIVSPTKPYLPTNEIVSGNNYAIVAADSAATFYFEDEAYGYLPTKSAKKGKGNYIETVKCAGFTFTAADGGYTIQDELGRYVYHKGTYNNFNYADERPAEGAVWSVTFDNEGNAAIACDGYTIHYSTKYKTYGCYTADKVTEEHVLPKLYMQYEYPKATITPTLESDVENLKEITITCEKGISFKEGTVLKTYVESTGGVDITGYKETTFTCEQVDDNTLRFTCSEPVTTADNIDLYINLKGTIYLEPNSMNMVMPKGIGYYNEAVCKYRLVGNAPVANILESSPENNSEVEFLDNIIFTFDKIVNGCDTTKTAKLYVEGTTEIIPLTFKTSIEGVEMKSEQAALSTAEPVYTNGTYILEVEDGYFLDRNGKAVKGTTLQFTVKNDTSIEDIIAGEENGWVVFNVNGIKVLETSDANELNSLSNGIYIINGVKAIVK